MSSVLRSVRKRKKGRTLGAVDTFAVQSQAAMGV